MPPGIRHFPAAVRLSSTSSMRCFVEIDALLQRQRRVAARRRPGRGAGRHGEADGRRGEDGRVKGKGREGGGGRQAVAAGARLPSLSTPSSQPSSTPALNQVTANSIRLFSCTSRELVDQWNTLKGFSVNVAQLMPVRYTMVLELVFSRSSNLLEQNECAAWMLEEGNILPSDASFGYPGGPILFKNLNFGIDLDSRIASLIESQRVKLQQKAKEDSAVHRLNKIKLYQALPIFLDRIFSPVLAIVLSVTFVFAFGEVVPQAIYTRYGLAVGSSFVWLVRILMAITYSISYPIGKRGETPRGSIRNGEKGEVVAGGAP